MKGPTLSAAHTADEVSFSEETPQACGKQSFRADSRGAVGGQVRQMRDTHADTGPQLRIRDATGGMAVQRITAGSDSTADSDNRPHWTSSSEFSATRNCTAELAAMLMRSRATCMARLPLEGRGQHWDADQQEAVTDDESASVIFWTVMQSCAVEVPETRDVSELQSMALRAVSGA